MVSGVTGKPHTWAHIHFYNPNLLVWDRNEFKYELINTLILTS